MLIRVFSLVFVALVLAQGSGQDLESPRLQALRNALAQDSDSALDSFWNEVKTKTPLIERLDEHQGYALVTFLWRGEPRTQHVFVDGQLGQLTGTRPDDNAMTRLADTNLWYRSYWLRSDVRTIYRFSVAVEGNDGEREYPDPRAPRGQGEGDACRRCGRAAADQAPSRRGVPWRGCGRLDIIMRHRSPLLTIRNYGCLPTGGALAAES